MLRGLLVAQHTMESTMQSETAVREGRAPLKSQPTSRRNSGLLARDNRAPHLVFDEIDRPQLALTILQCTARDLHHVLADDGKAGNVKTGVAPALVAVLYAQLLQDVLG